MAKGLPPCTPTRRSRRGQPIAISTSQLASTSGSTLSWSSEAVHSRATNPELDLLDDERDLWNKQDEEERAEIQTHFYEGFAKQKASASLKSRGKGGKTAPAGEVETYSLGDTVLAQTWTMATRKVPSVAVIVDMWETDPIGEDDERDGQARMHLLVHWFLRASDLPAIRAKRDHSENEVFYSVASSGVISASAVVSHCTIQGSQGLMKKAPAPAPASPRKGGWQYVPVDDSDEEGGGKGTTKSVTLQCFLAVDSRRGYHYSLDWTEHHRTALETPKGSAEPAVEWGTGAAWDVIPADEDRVDDKLDRGRTGGRKKTVKDDPESDSDTDDAASDTYEAPENNSDEDEEHSDPAESDEEPEPSDEEDEEEDYDEPQTPSRSRKRKRTTDTLTTPRKRTRTFVQPTPHTKRILTKQSRAKGTPKKLKKIAARYATTYAGSDDMVKHLPKDPWLRAMHVLHVGSRPDALPCREEEFSQTLKSVDELLEEGSGGCIYISGVPGTGKTATVHAVIRELKRMAEANETNPFTYVEINGLKIPEPNAAYNLLWEGISGHNVAKDGHLNISAKESLKSLTRYFSGGAGRGRGPGGHACVVLMDELDQVVTSKQDVVYNFFNWPTLVGSKLVVIAVANTMDLPERVMTGRVRSRLGMIRVNFQPYSRAQLEEIVKTRLASAMEGMENEKVQDVIAPDGIKLAAMKVASISGDARRVLDVCRRTVEMVQARKRTARTKDVDEVIRVMQNSPIAAYLRDCSFHERMMLASLVKCIKREGVEEIKWGEVQHQHLVYMSVLTSASDPTRKPTPHELSMVLESLVASRAMLVEDGATALRKAEEDRKVVLNLEQSEVERVLAEVGGTRWKNVLG